MTPGHIATAHSGLILVARRCQCAPIQPFCTAYRRALHTVRHADDETCTIDRNRPHVGSVLCTRRGLDAEGSGICTHTHTHTPFNVHFPGLPGKASTRKLNPIWILLKQETASSSGKSWAICKSAPRSRQVTTPAPRHSVFYRPDARPATQPTASKHWRPRNLPVRQICLAVVCTATACILSLANYCT